MNGQRLFTDPVRLPDYSYPDAPPLYEGDPADAFMTLTWGIFPAVPLDDESPPEKLILVVIDGQSFAVTDTTEDGVTTYEVTT